MAGLSADDVEGFFDEPNSEIAAKANGRHYPAADPEQLRRAAQPSHSYKLWLPPEIWGPIDPPVYAMSGLAQGDVGMVCAHGASLKSWMGINAVLAKASGGRWLERFPLDAGPAIYVDNEMGPDECRRRFQVNGRGMGLNGPVDDVALVSMPGFTMQSGMKEIERLAEGRALMLIDSLAAFSPDAQENEAAFADPLKRLKEIGDRTRCAFLLLHHSRKSGDGSDDKRERPRGTSALFAACDAVFLLSRHGDGGAFLVEQSKARKGKALEPFVVNIADVEEFASTRVFASDVEDDPELEESLSALDRAKARIVAVLSYPGSDCKSFNDLFRRAKGQRSTALAAFKELLEHGKVVDKDGKVQLA